MHVWIAYKINMPEARLKFVSALPLKSSKPGWFWRLLSTKHYTFTQKLVTIYTEYQFQNGRSAILEKCNQWHVSYHMKCISNIRSEYQRL